MELSNQHEVFRRDELLARCVGRLDFAERIVGKFLEHFARDMDQLEQSLVQGDLSALACTAHRMKGAAANVAAPALLAQTAEIENSARQDRREELPVSLCHLREEWKRFSASVACLSSAVARPHGAA
jgi:HPt (histidine-containing phosphotransfer) domain-containing protein